MKFHQIEIPIDRIRDFCSQRKVREFAFFGSVLTDNFSQNSDIDILITFLPDSKYSLFDLAQMQMELEQLLGRKVDLVEKESLVNPFRKHAILNNMEVVYAA